MLIADKLKHTNRAEYLLYLWQVEDLLRSFDCDAERVCRDYVSRFRLDDEKRKATEQWYTDLCRMMLAEGLRQSGHLPLSRNVLQELVELHGKLLASGRFPYYREMYYRVLPYIVELRAKGGSKDEPELQTCFDALYGVWLLRLQKREVSENTAKATKDISALLGQLSDYWKADREGKLELQ